MKAPLAHASSSKKVALTGWTPSQARVEGFCRTCWCSRVASPSPRRCWRSSSRWVSTRGGPCDACARGCSLHEVRRRWRSPTSWASLEAEAQLRGLPYEFDIETRTSLFCMLGEWSQAMEIAESFLVRLEGSDSPLRHASGAYSGFRTLSLAKASGVEAPPRLRSLAHGSVLRAREGYAEIWRPSYYGVRLLLAEAHEGRLDGKPTGDRLRSVLDLAAPFGAYFALEPRLLLAEDLLTHGERDEGRELLVRVWADAQEMGARDYERQAFKLATRSRVPLPEQAADAGPLNRLTPREREVLDLLADGATNRAIAAALFITEKTASVHVSHVLSKLGVPNRGAAAALAHRYA